MLPTFPAKITSLAGTPFFRKRGAGCIKKGPVPPFSLKKGALAPSLREKGVPAKKMIPKCTDRDFLWYRYGKYREIMTNTDRKIPIPYNSSKGRNHQAFCGPVLHSAFCRNSFQSAQDALQCNTSLSKFEPVLLTTSQRSSMAFLAEKKTSTFFFPPPP
jgi:hypothetical protein